MCGGGKSGQLGRADSTESSASFRSLPVPVDFFNKGGFTVNQVCCGGSHTIASVIKK
jgi:hypothetical protein